MRGIHIILQGLNENEIKQVLEGLRQLDAKPADKSRNATVRRVVDGQSLTVRKLERIIIEWQLRNKLLNLSRAFRNLAEGGQQENMKLTRDIASQLVDLKDRSELDQHRNSRLNSQIRIREAAQRLSDSLALHVNSNIDLLKNEDVRSALDLAVTGPQPLAAYHVVTVRLKDPKVASKDAVPLSEYFEHTTAGLASARQFVRENDTSKGALVWSVHSSIDGELGNSTITAEDRVGIVGQAAERLKTNSATALQNSADLQNNARRVMLERAGLLFQVIPAFVDEDEIVAGVGVDFDQGGAQVLGGNAPQEQITGLQPAFEIASQGGGIVPASGAALLRFGHDGSPCAILSLRGEGCE